MDNSQKTAEMFTLLKIVQDYTIMKALIITSTILNNLVFVKSHPELWFLLKTLLCKRLLKFFKYISRKYEHVSLNFIIHFFPGSKHKEKTSFADKKFLKMEAFFFKYT